MPRMPSSSSEVHIDHFDVAAERAKALRTLNNSRSWGVECFPAELYLKKKKKRAIGLTQFKVVLFTIIKT